MGIRNRERRAAKAKRRAREQRARQQQGHQHRDQRSNPWDGGSPVDRAELLLSAATDARLRGNQERSAELVDQLAPLGRPAMTDVAAGKLRRAVPRLWDNGWQPAELVRQARRTSTRASRVVAAAVLADHADRSRQTLDDRWVSQVDEIAAGAREASAAAGRPGWLAAHAKREGLDGADLAIVLVEALAAVFALGPLRVIMPPPGQAKAGTSRAPTGGVGQVDDPVLAKVRALLAKAESTTYEAEAAAFTAKAQELMARHAIDIARVWDEAGRDEQPITIRLPIDDPYVDAKSLLLHVVATHSRCRMVIHSGYALCSVVGFASDVAATEVLFTSLLVQSQVAMQAEAAAAGPGSRARSRSFRSTFLVAYAHRIGERLAEVNAHVESTAAADVGGSSLLPVLVARSDAIDAAVDELFGELHSSPIRGGDDPVGWARGRAAADRARLALDLEEAS